MGSRGRRPEPDAALAGGGAGRAAGTDIRWLALAVLAGVLAVHALADLPPLWLFIPLLLPALWRWPGRGLYLAGVLAGAWTCWLAGNQLAQRLPPAEDGSRQWLQGRIETIPESDAHRSRFQFVTDTRPRRIRVAWYGEHPPLQVGDCWNLLLGLSAPRGSLNPGGFDYEAWLWRQQIGATGYVREARSCVGAAGTSLGRGRQRAVERIDAILGGHPMTGVVRALTVGERGAITDDQWRILRHTGTSHLVAISGLHIGLIAAFVFFVLRWGLPRLPGGFRLNAPVFAAAGAALAATIYALLAGLALPTQRALVMTLVVLLAVFLRRPTAPSQLLALAALVVLVLDPAAVLAPGFWLSFGAVAWILYLLRGRVGGAGRWRVWLGLQPALVLALAPITLYWFGEASVVAPLANAVLIPAFALVVPAVLTVTILALAWPQAGAPLLTGTADVLGWGWSVLTWLEQWPLAHLQLPMPDIPAALAASAGIALLLAPRGVPARWLGVIGLLALLVAPAAPRTGGFRLVLLDVGQGLSAVVRTAEHNLLFDAGPRYRTGFNAGEALVLPYLRAAGVGRLHKLVLSHGDIDHRGGVAAVRAGLPVDASVGVEQSRPCRAGRHWRWDGVDFEFLHPDGVDWSGNNASCVLRVEGPGGSLLLTGDIEAGAERSLVARHTAALDTDILVVPHHGSATSSSKVFLEAVTPRWALVPAGWNNRWDFPRPEVVRRLREVGARVLVTGEEGAIRFDIDPQAGLAAPGRWRRDTARFWRAPAGPEVGR